MRHKCKEKLQAVGACIHITDERGQPIPLQCQLQTHRRARSTEKSLQCTTDRYSCTRAAQGPCTIIGTFTEVCVYPPLLTVNSLSTYSWVLGCTDQSVFLEWGSESVDKNGLCHRWNFSPKLCKASLQPHCPSLIFLLLEFVQMLNNGACSPATGNRSVQLFSLSKRNQDKCISHL